MTIFIHLGIVAMNDGFLPDWINQPNDEAPKQDLPSNQPIKTSNLQSDESYHHDLLGSHTCHKMSKQPSWQVCAMGKK
ncbi:hypothetical protein [Moraxella sp.]|uniref:hypothetical protein n=1 Tax=Moraxella sp. TaxID=479 RepID=UPI0026DA9863|nr:hypothetical protein [Moraxella sp.]MDO4895141.1 hypothetical protein [Moraxella sp.]